MLNTVLKLIISIFKMFRYPFYIICCAFLLFALLVIINLIILRFKGYKIKKGTRVRVKRQGLIRRIFLEAPKRYAKDLVERDPDFFRHQGLVVYTGRQGRGKSIALVEHAMRMQKEYPLSKCISNMAYAYETEPLKHWRQLVNYKNGIFGLIVMIDELQTWFSSNQSRNFPPEMLEVITQNRKNRRIILGTSQSFHLLAKAIRTQCTEVRECFTAFGCITFVRRKEPILDADGDVVEWKNRGFYFFVHTDKIREAYDTWAVIESLAKSGFVEKDYLLDNNLKVVVNMDK